MTVALASCLLPAISRPEMVRIPIAVYDLEPANTSAGDATLLSDLLRSALLAADTFQVIEKSRMDQVLKEQAFQMTGCTSDECAVRVGRLLNVRKIVVGTAGRLGEGSEAVWYVTTRLVDVESGRVEATAVRKGFRLDRADEAMESLASILSGRGEPGRTASVEGLPAQRPHRPDDLRIWASLAGGASQGIMRHWHANSMFKGGPRPAGVPLWSADTAEVDTRMEIPPLGLRLGVEGRWWGAFCEASFVEHVTPQQQVFFDAEGSAIPPSTTSLCRSSWGGSPSPRASSTCAPSGSGWGPWPLRRSAGCGRIWAGASRCS